MRWGNKVPSGNHDWDIPCMKNVHETVKKMYSLENPKKCPCMHHSKFKGCIELLPMHATDSTPDNTTGAMLDAYSVIQKTGSISDNLQNTLILTFCWWGQSTPADTPHLKAFKDARLQTLEQPGQWHFGDARLQNIVRGVCQRPQQTHLEWLVAPF